MRPGIFVSRTREKLGHTCDQIGRTLEPCTLEAFGFIEDFVNKIKVLYNDTESVVKVNGGLSAPFKLTRCKTRLSFVWNAVLCSHRTFFTQGSRKY